MALILLMAASTAFGQGEQRPVRVAEVERAPLPISVELVGTVKARNESALSTQVEGLVEVLEVDAGGEVNAGDVLLKLDSTLSDIRRAQTEEELKAAKVELADARQKLQEVGALVESGGISKSELETRQAEVHVREADAARLELILREEKEIVQRHTLRAPFPGVISERYAQVGEWVSPGVPLFQMVETGFRTFDIQAPQNLFLRVSEKTRAEVQIDLAPEQRFPAKVAVIVPTKSTETRAFLLRLEVDAPERLLLPGASGRAKLFIGGDEPRTSVPVDALVRQPDGSYVVWVVSGSGSQPLAEMRRIEVGERAEDRIEILAGVQAGETVIIRGNENLVPGQAIRILPSQDSGS
jgi:RND family efflux transporter MFP subunit